MHHLRLFFTLSSILGAGTVAADEVKGPCVIFWMIY